MLLLQLLALFSTVARASPSTKALVIRAQVNPGPAAKLNDAIKNKICIYGSDDMGSMDCVLALSISRAPAICDTDPGATDCVLNYLGAFCGDLVESRKANKPLPDADVQTALENCAIRISQGPCVANPTGAACKSDLFAGIKFLGPPTGGSGISKRESIDKFHAMFPRERRAKNAWALQFIFGFLKSVFNEVLKMAYFIFNWAQGVTAIRCIAIAYAVGNEWLHNACIKLWNGANHKAPQVAYTNNIQKAGSITALVLMALAAVYDAALAVEYVGTAAWVGLRALFKAPEVYEATVAGKLLKGFKFFGKGTAKDSTSVEIIKLGPKGEELPFATTEEAEVALDQGLENAFVNCVERRVPVKLMKRGCFSWKNWLPSCLKRPSGLKIACPPVTSGDIPEVAAERAEPPPSIELSGIQPETPYEGIGFVPNTLSPAEMEGLKEMHLSYTAWAERGKSTWPTWSEELKVWADRFELADVVGDPVGKAQLAYEYGTVYGLEPEEVNAINGWARSYTIDEERLKSAFSKLPNYSGICEHTTRLADETLQMLVNRRPGVDNVPGVYDVSDLVTNIKSTAWADQNLEIQKLIMSTHPGLSQMYRARNTRAFIIRSRFGKYISPISKREPEQVEFMNLEQGKFKLLGWSKDAKGDPGVFFFDNIEA